MIHIERATVADAEAILDLQKLSYESEARLYDDWTIPPLTQTLDTIRTEFARRVVLKAHDGSKLLGSVRGVSREGTGFVERLIVHPDAQGRGIGTSLLGELEIALVRENTVPPVSRFELFTGHLSARNLAFYEKRGYERFKRERIHPRLELVYLQKPVIRKLG